MCSICFPSLHHDRSAQYIAFASSRASQSRHSRRAHVAIPHGPKCTYCLISPQSRANPPAQTPWQESWLNDMANHGSGCGHSSGASSRARITPLTKEKLEFAFPQMLKAMTCLGNSLQNPTVRTYIHRNRRTSHIRLWLFPSSSQVRGGWDRLDHLLCFHEGCTHGGYGITVHFRAELLLLPRPAWLQRR